MTAPDQGGRRLTRTITRTRGTADVLLLQSDAFSDRVGSRLTDDDLTDLYAFDGLRGNVISGINGGGILGGLSGGLGGPGDRRLFQLLRTVADAVLVGAGTVAAEGYGPLTGQRLVVASASASLDPGARCLSGGNPLVVVHPDADKDRVARLADVAEIAVAASAADMRATLAARGLTRVHCEGGHGLLTSLLPEITELDVTLAPMLAEGWPILPSAGPDAIGFRPAHVIADDDGYLYIRWLRTTT